jgi:hypothetical protein
LVVISSTAPPGSRERPATDERVAEPFQPSYAGAYLLFPARLPVAEHLCVMRLQKREALFVVEFDLVQEQQHLLFVIRL